jgi:hypothetical protein
MLEEIFRIVRPLAQEFGISVLCQGKHGSRKMLLNKFKTSHKTVLFEPALFGKALM